MNASVSNITHSVSAQDMALVRKQYLAGLSLRAQSTGGQQGLAVGRAIHKATVHTKDTASTGYTAAAGYTTGFARGFWTGVRGG